MTARHATLFLTLAVFAVMLVFVNLHAWRLSFMLAGACSGIAATRFIHVKLLEFK